MPDLYCYQCEVIRVLDGDTIEGVIDLGFGIKLKKKIRFSGVNTPELRDPDPVVRQKAQDAKAVVEAFLQPNDVIIIHSVKGDFDSFGRVLAKVFYKDGDLGEFLIEQGLGIPF